MAESPLSKYKLDEIDKTILKLKVNYIGITHAEIGEEIGMSRQGVNIRINKPAFQKALQEIFDEPIDKLKKGLHKAVSVFMKALESDNEWLRVRVAEKILVSEGVLRKELAAHLGEDAPLIIDIPTEGKKVVIGSEKKINALSLT